MAEKSIKVYHYSNKPIQQFENRIGGTWFTDNSYRYPRRRSAEIKHTMEIPKELKLAPAKVANKYLYQGNKELMQVELSKLGYDGVKINVGGDNQYLIFDINKIKPITESIEKVTESTAKTAYKGALKKGLKTALMTGGGMALGALMSPPVQAAQTILENPEEANPVPEYGTLHSQVEQPYLYTNKVQNQVGLPNGQMPNPANYNIDVRKQAYKNMRSKW